MVPLDLDSLPCLVLYILTRYYTIILCIVYIVLCETSHMDPYCTT